jgi:hypothetical protein
MLLLVVRSQEITSKEFIFLGEHQTPPPPRRELRTFGARNSGLSPQSVSPPFATTLEPRLIRNIREVKGHSRLRPRVELTTESQSPNNVFKWTGDIFQNEHFNEMWKWYVGLLWNKWKHNFGFTEEITLTSHRRRRVDSVCSGWSLSLYKLVQLDRSYLFPRAALVSFLFNWHRMGHMVLFEIFEIFKTSMEYQSHHNTYMDGYRCCWCFCLCMWV